MFGVIAFEVFIAVVMAVWVSVIVLVELSWERRLNCDEANGLANISGRPPGLPRFVWCEFEKTRADKFRLHGDSAVACFHPPSIFRDYP
ncbi:MAG: hypothetical protein ABSH48_16875 [Verrucomicrobiota bacterium]